MSLLKDTVTLICYIWHNIGGRPYTVKFVVAEFDSGEKYYDHSLTEIEKGALLNRAELSSTVAESKTPISDIKDKRLVSILQINSSKEVRPRTTKGLIHTYMNKRHLAAMTSS